MTAYGASCPFPWVLANVRSPKPQQSFGAGNGTDAPPRGIGTLASKPNVTPKSAGRLR